MLYTEYMFTHLMSTNMLGILKTFYFIQQLHNVIVLLRHVLGTFFIRANYCDLCLHVFRAKF